MSDNELAAYGYHVNVRDKVKKLESQKSATILEKTTKKPLTKNSSIDDVTEDNSPAAVMDVETIQFNSPSVQNTFKEVKVITNFTNEPEIEDRPVNVKNLLRRFSSGMTQTFRRKSMIPEANDATDELNATDLEKKSTSKPTEMQTFKSNKKPMEARVKPIQSVDVKSEFQNQDKSNILNSTAPQMKSPEDEKKQSSFALSKLIPFKRSQSIEVKKEAEIVQSLDMEGNDTELKSKINLKYDSILKASEEKIPQHSSTITSEGKLITKLILIIGLGRSGKSSIVNYLLRQDLSTVYKSPPQERQIVECRANTNANNLGSIIVTDTPGFTNTPEEDASLFSTLNNYYKSLKLKPDLILAVLKHENYSDYSAGHEALENFLKVLSHYHKNHFDSTPLVQFVVTHMDPLGAEVLMNISQEFTHAIEKNTNIFNPNISFHRVGSENSSQDLNRNQDLLQTMRHLLEPSKQNILKIAFGSNYPRSLSNCFVSNRITLHPPNHPDTIKMQGTLQNIYKDMIIEKTEISTLLEIGWENIDVKLREKYQLSLITLQQTFQKCDIKTFDELPEEPMKILELLHQIPNHNPAIADLLTETLQLKVPCCYAAMYVGQGYDLSRDAVTHISPFEFTGQLKASSVGLIPEELSCKVIDDREIIYKFYHSFEDYVIDRFKDIGISNVSFPKHNPPSNANQRNGYNIEQTKSSVATACIEYRLFQLSLIDCDLNFKPQFWDSLASLPELDTSNIDIVENWEEFFKYWGTHVVKSAYGGGSIQVNFRGKLLRKVAKQDSLFSSDEYETNKVFQWITGDGLEFVFMKQDSKAEFLQGYDVDSTFIGGDMRFQQFDLTKIHHDKVSGIRNDWIQSLALNPVILQTNLILIPISYFVREKSEAFATKMDIAFFHFYSNFMGLNKQSCRIL